MALNKKRIDNASQKQCTSNISDMRIEAMKEDFSPFGISVSLHDVRLIQEQEEKPHSDCANHGSSRSSLDLNT